MTRSQTTSQPFLVTGLVHFTFSVHLGKNAFRCLNAACAAQGNALDLWAAARHLRLREAAIDLAETFQLQLAPAKRATR